MKICIALLYCMLVVGPALAQTDVLRVSFHEHPPWQVINPDGTPGGIDMMLLRTLTKRMGLTVKFSFYPFKRGLLMLKSGEIDLMTGVLRRPEREQFLHYIEPPYKDYSNKAFYVLKGQEASIKSHQDLYGLRIGTNIGAKYFPAFDNDQSLDKHSVGDEELSLRMLLAGRIDTFIMTESTGDYRIAKLDVGHRVGKAELAYRKRQNVYMVLSKKSPLSNRINEFNTIMAHIIRDGTFEQIKTRYFQKLNH